MRCERNPRREIALHDGSDRVTTSSPKLRLRFGGPFGSLRLAGHLRWDREALVKFLYGDSTPSPLKSNYLFYVRDAIELCVHLLLAQERINTLRTDLRGIEAYAESERGRIAGLRELVLDAAESANTDGPESMSKRAVDRVIEVSKQAIASTLAELEAKLAAGRAAIAAKDREERDGCLDAFGKYIALHQVHEGDWRVSAKLDDAGHYECETWGRAPYGAAWKCAIELAGTHPMAKALRVGDVVTQIELALPEGNAWQKRTPKRRPQRLDGFTVEELVTNGENIGIALRATPRGPFGIDIEFRGNELRVTSAGARDPFDVELDDDARQRISTLRNKLVDVLTTHPGVRRRVVTATLDDAPLADADDLATVAKRLIDAAAPIVQQIRAHSLSPRELVIRRLLDDNERVEIFVSTADLLEKLGRLPRALRGLFEPLGLEWQRARTPVPGEIYVEPPREPAERPVAEPRGSEPAREPERAVAEQRASEPAREPEPPSEAPRKASDDASESARSPASAAPKDELPLRDSQPLPLPTASQVMLPYDDKQAAASSIDAALQRVSFNPNAAPEPTRPPPLTTIAIDARDRGTLAATVKRIIGAARDGSTQLAFQAYAALFDDEEFAHQRAQDQRQVLKLMVMAKNVPPSSPAVVQAYRSALKRLQALADEGNDAGDHEMVGVCMRVLASLEA
jgi:hypothetical protein